MAGKVTQTVAKRLLSKIEKDYGPKKCWLWIGAKFQSDYGVIRVNNKYKRAHRVAYEVFKGVIPDGLEVCHTCDFKMCVNPDHLIIATHAENMADAAARGLCWSPNKK
jgi:hypothetical protein